MNGREMTRAEARAELEAAIAPDCQPVLDEAEVERLLDACRVADRYGIAPTEPGWTPTWCVPYAAATGWALKAARLAAETSFTADGASYDRSSAYKQALDMARAWRARIVGGVAFKDPEEYRPDVVER